jgi:hypothetical protein
MCTDFPNAIHLVKLRSGQAHSVIFLGLVEMNEPEITGHDGIRCPADNGQLTRCRKSNDDDSF